MEIYLPLANVYINPLVIIILGVVVGILSGMLGIGGGIILNPALIKLGIPPIVTVGTSISQMIGASVSGFFTHWKLKNIDLKMGIFIVVFGVIGGTLGTIISHILEKAGHFREAVLTIYTVYLFILGSLILIDALKKKKENEEGKLKKFADKLPFKIKFQIGDVSLLVPAFVGISSGLLASMLGIGGGNITTPALMYFANYQPQKAVALSIFQMMFVTIFLTYFHSTINHNVDIILSFILLLGSSFGAVFGAYIGQKLGRDKLKGFLAILMIAVGFTTFYELVFGKEKAKAIITISNNIITKFALENPSLYAILVIVISLIAGIIISAFAHRLRTFILIIMEKKERNK